MADKTGKVYENLTQVIFQLIVNQTDVPNVVVQHDVKLQGKHNNTHQIDVYWKFALDRMEYETVVQAKDWKNPVDQGELLKFKAVLDDLPGQPKGIFVSRSGYQQGAIDFALAHGILIYELREADNPPNLGMTVGSWAKIRLVRLPLRAIITKRGEPIPDENNLYGLGFDIEIFTPVYSNPQLTVSTSWLQGEYPTIDVSKITRLDFRHETLHENRDHDEDGGVNVNLARVLHNLAMSVHEEGLDEKRVTQVFETPSFVRADSGVTARIKIEAVSVDVKIERRHEVRHLRVDNFPQWVLHQINAGVLDWFGASPAVTSLLPDKNSV